MVQKFTFSLVYNPKGATMEIYKTYFDRLAQHGIIVDYGNFEHSERGKLHFHGILRMPDPIRWHQLHALCKQPGFNYRKDTIKCELGWERYIQKDQLEGKREYDVQDGMWFCERKFDDAIYHTGSFKGTKWGYKRLEIHMDDMNEKYGEVFVAG